MLFAETMECLKRVLEAAATAPGNRERFLKANLIETTSSQESVQLVPNWHESFEKLASIDKQTIRQHPGLFMANADDVVYRGMTSGSRGQSFIYRTYATVTCDRFRVVVSTDKTEFVVTNDIAQNSTDAVQEVCGIRWKIEEFHRELKQLTGVESCQCRKARIQRNHISCAMLVWLRLKDLAYKTGKTIYQLKHGLLSNYLIEQLKYPSIPMTLV